LPPGWRTDAISRPLALINARLVDPASGHDGPGALLVRDGLIEDVTHGAFAAPTGDAEVFDCAGALLTPGLIDLRVKTGEPGSETKETLGSAARAAAAGGVTSFVVQPDTHPAVDEPSVADFILRRARDISEARIYPAGAVTRGLGGEQLAEIGLMQEAGCVYFTDADKPILDSRVLMRALKYASGFNAWIAHRPGDPWLTRGAAATGGEFASRLGLPSSPAGAEQIGLERDLALAEMARGRLLVDQVSTAGSLSALARAKDRGVEAAATASINHLSFNELDIGDYRTFAKLDPPLRAEADRRALVEGLSSGLVDIVVSAHAPAPAEDKRLPFDEAAPGSVGLETLFSALLALHHNDGLPLVVLLRTVTLAPAQLLGLAAGRLARGAPADLAVCDLNAPVLIDSSRLLSRSKNSTFDGRRLQGQVRATFVGGQKVYSAA
jgi:dihydroorotase